MAADGRPGAVVESMDAEHAVYRLSPKSHLRILQWLGLIPAQQDATASRWDRFIGIHDGGIPDGGTRDGEVEAVGLSKPGAIITSKQERCSCPD